MWLLVVLTVAGGIQATETTLSQCTWAAERALETSQGVTEAYCIRYGTTDTVWLVQHGKRIRIGP